MTNEERLNFQLKRLDLSDFDLGCLAVVFAALSPEFLTWLEEMSEEDKRGILYDK